MIKRCETYRDFEWELIAQWFTYDPETGQLFRREEDRTVRELTTWREDQERGALGPTSIMFGGYQIQATHVMFMLMERRWPRPNMTVDHKDGVIWNMKWSNLREATGSQNKV
jgi:hypothetical protein